MVSLFFGGRIDSLPWEPSCWKEEGKRKKKRGEEERGETVEKINQNISQTLQIISSALFNPHMCVHRCISELKKKKKKNEIKSEKIKKRREKKRRSEENKHKLFLRRTLPGCPC